MRYLIPVALLAGLLLLFAAGLKNDPREIPSPLIGKSVPAFALNKLGGGERLTEADLRGRPLLVNFFASWCAGCQVEHPLLMRLAQQGVEIIGMDYKDAPADAAQWLQRHGNPYRLVIADEAGRAGLDFGVYGVPETFVLDAQGFIVHKHVGPVTETAWLEDIAPKLGFKTP